MNEALGVLVVDDSALMRSLITKMIESVPGLAVVDRAMNGLFALQKIPRCHPDVIVLDLEMPQLDGIGFLRERKRLGIDIPVIILSSLARRGAEITMEALALGASDFIMKPSGSISQDIHCVKDQLADRLLAYGAQYRLKHGVLVPKPSLEEFTRLERRNEEAKPRSLINEDEWRQDRETPSQSVKLEAPAKTRWEQRPKPLPPPTPLRKPGPTELIAIGISTGGPNALREIFSALDADLDRPILVVQHMPPGFTAEFAKSLDRICPLEVKEAAEGDLVLPGRILIAPGDRHLELEKRPLATIAHISDSPTVNGHRPSADVLFASVAKQYGNKALGVIMTGMGRDGARELGSIYREGGITLGQDESSSVVYGMPRVAWELGHVMEQVPLAKMAARICELAKEERH